MRLANAQPDLESQLTAYAAAVKSADTSATWNSRLGRWSLYAAATGAALASATSADASVITGFSGASLTGGRAACGCNVFSSVRMKTHPGVSTTNTVAALSLFARYIRRVRSYGTNFRVGQVGVVYPTGVPRSKSINRFFLTPSSRSTGGATSHLKLFPAGIPIQAGGRYSAGAALRTFLQIYARSFTANKGTWPSSFTGIAGFQLRNGELGWIKLKWTSSLHDGIPDIIQAFDWAINTEPNVGIYAGTLDAVPEPGTFPLSLLALGAAGIAALRRSRRERPEA